MRYLNFIYNVGALLLLSACQHEEVVQAPPPPPPVIIASPGQVVQTPHTTILMEPTPIPASTQAPGTIELSGFNPVVEDPARITRLEADRVDQDATGKYTLRGRAVVEIAQGAAMARMTGEQITVQSGPGFKAEVVRRGAKE